MDDARFKFALAQLEPSQWRLLEGVARQFLATEFPELREVALASGDRGRDGVLWTPEGEDNVVVQASTSVDWAAKINATVRVLHRNNIRPTVLIYVTNRAIGAAADDLKASLRRDKDLALDVRDQSWFLQRQHSTATTIEAAERLAASVADPILLDKGMTTSAGLALDEEESRAALLALILERQDATEDRHLTKLSFDALVRSALSGTDAEHRLTRAAVQDSVLAMLDMKPSEEVVAQTNRALERLERQYIRHHQAEDEFCLAYSERTRLAEAVAQFAEDVAQLDSALLGELEFVAEGMGVDLFLADEEQLIHRCRRVLERFLFERGEAFATAILADQQFLFLPEEIEHVVTKDLLQVPDRSSLRGQLPALISTAITRLLKSGEHVLSSHLKRLADGYTLFAFLRETPNVQRALSKLFTRGEYWIDTSALLPILAEDLLSEPDRQMSKLYAAARQSGATLRITPGVIDEVLHHLKNCWTAFSDPYNYRRRTPFLYSAFLWSGRDNARFPQWLDTFRGSRRPADDLAEYLEVTHGIRTGSLDEALAECDDDLRFACQRVWRDVHTKRRTGVDEVSADVIEQLVQRDVETFLGVLQRRRGETGKTAFGYETWLVTFDGRVEEVREVLNSELDEALDTPALSIDFLCQYLSVGPARHALDRDRQERLPVIVDREFIDAMPGELIDAANSIRLQYGDASELLVRRGVRDHLDVEKLRSGDIAKGGVELLELDIQHALETQAADT